VSQPAVPILLICGPAGVGKSTLGWEISAQLRSAGVAHAVLDSDELNRVWPLSSADQEQLCRANLAAFWANAGSLGVRRLVLVGVFLDLDADRGWLAAAVPGAELIRIVLDASDEQLEARVRRREIGSDAEAQLARTLTTARAGQRWPCGRRPGRRGHRRRRMGSTRHTGGRAVTSPARRGDSATVPGCRLCDLSVAVGGAHRTPPSHLRRSHHRR